MNKQTVLSAILGAAMLLTATPALAASVSATAIFSGQTQFSGTQNQTTQVSIPVDALSGETVHAVRTEVTGSNIAPKCQDISDFGGPQANHQVSVGITLPPNTGDYGFTVTPFYTNNDQAASALHNDVACSPSASNFMGTAYSQGNVIHVLPGGSTGGGLYNGMDIAALIQMLKDAGFTISSPGTGSATPPANPNCPVMVYDGSNASAVQGWLIAHGQAGPFAAVGVYAPTGNWKTASITAYTNALAACK